MCDNVIWRAMSSSFLIRIRPLRRIAMAMAVVMLLAGMAQAAHFHQDDSGRVGGADVHCLLCQYAGGHAAAPAVPLLPSAATAHDISRPRLAIFRAEKILAASYDARGPPQV
jgi:hypothetical protein